MKTTEIFIKSLNTFFSKGITQSHLADAIGVARQHLNDFIKGRRNFSEEKKEKIAEVLGMTYVDMLIIGKSIVDGETAPDIKNKKISSTGNQNEIPIPEKVIVKYPVLNKIIETSNLAYAEKKPEKYLCNLLISKISNYNMDVDEKSSSES